MPWGVILSVALVGGGWAQTQPAPIVLRGVTPIAEVRQLALDRARAGERVRLRAVSIYHDEVLNALFVQDATGGLFVRVPATDLPLAGAQSVEIEGVTSLDTAGVLIADSRIKVLGPAMLPAARALTVGQLADGGLDPQWVELHGEVRSVRERPEGSRLHLHAGARHCDVLVRDPAARGRNLDMFFGARVKLRGVCFPAADESGVTAPLAVPRLDDIQIEQGASVHPFDVPPVAIRLITEGHVTNRVKVMAKVARPLSDDVLWLQDATGQLRVKLEHAPARIEVQDEVEALGYAESHGDGVGLDHAICRVIARAAAQGKPRFARADLPPEPYLPVLQAVHQVLDLNPEDAALGFPVRLRGVVTYHDPALGRLFVRGMTNGIAVRPAKDEPALPAGQAIELDGYTQAGDYAPEVVQARVKSAGRAQLPSPKEPSPDRLLSGDYHAQWIALDGIVRAVGLDRTHRVLRLATGGLLVNVIIPDPDESTLSALVDAEVRVLGVCENLANRRRQIVGLRLFTPGVSEVMIRRPPPVDPFSAPVVNADGLQRFNPEGAPGHRVKVAGIVTRALGSNVFFLRDANSSLRVETLQPHAIQPGDVLEVIGFPGLAGYTPGLEDAVVRALRRSPPPRPYLISTSQGLKGAFDGELVSLEGHVVDFLSRSEPPALVMQNGPAVFEAALAQTNAGVALRRFGVGSKLRLTGICSVQADSQGQPRSFRLWLQSVSDLAVLERPPLLKREHALAGAGALGLLSLAATAWVVSLRRQVKRQTTTIERRLKQEQHLEARYRELFENANDIIYTTDLGGRLTSFNKAGEATIGYSSQEAVGKGLTELVAPEHAGAVQAMLDSHEPSHGANENGSANGGPDPSVFELALVTKDGRRIPLEVSTRLIYAEGQPAGFQCIARNVAERKQAEERIRQLNASLEQRVRERTAELEATNKDLESFSYSISHDLRTPIRTINSFSHLLLHDYGEKLDAEGRQQLQAIQANGRRMWQLVDDLLAFSRLGRQALAKSPLSLDELVRSIVNEACRIDPQRHVLVQVQPLPLASGDPAMVRQVFVNLIDNAFKYTRRQTQPTIEIGANAAANETVYFVKDNGAGFDMQHAGRLFGVFSRLHRQDEFEGTGVGLAIVQRIVQRHGGRIWAEGKVNAGATFYFTLPA